jgi:hypothetical protein
MRVGPAVIEFPPHPKAGNPTRHCAGSRQPAARTVIGNPPRIRSDSIGSATTG